MLKDFKKFILRGNTIDLAVAFVIGAEFNSTVTSLVKDLITPLISAIGGKTNLSNYYFTINHSRFLYGTFLSSLLSFIIIAATVFFLVVQPINKLTELVQKKKQPLDPTDKKCPECLSLIPLKAKRCMYCTAKQTDKHALKS